VFFASDERADALARLATLIDGIVNPRDKRAVVEWCAGPLMRSQVSWLIKHSDT